MANAKERQPALDVIRSLAIFCVISVHFFMNTGFYGTPVSGGRMLLMCAVRTFSMINIPLFLLLSGYLLSNQVPKRGYYRRIWRVIGTYLLACCFTLIFRAVYMKEPLRPLPILRSILNFSACPYAWYIEMYIGLFLLIPFLNLMYKAIPSRRWKQVMLISLAFMTVLPFTVNYFRLDTPGWFRNTSLPGSEWKLLPNWWYQDYPVFFFLLGCYIREYGAPLRPLSCLCMMVIILVGGTAFSLWMSGNHSLPAENWNNTPTFFPAILSYLVFVFLLKLPWQKLPNWILWCFKWVSRLSLGTYLVSWCFDQLVYQRLKAAVPSLYGQLLYYPLVVGAVLLLSTAASWFLLQAQSLPHYVQNRKKRKMIRHNT